MNRNRIGLAALVVGIGAAVRRQMQTRTDAGRSAPEPTSATPTADRIVADNLDTPRPAEEIATAESAAQPVAEALPAEKAPRADVPPMEASSNETAPSAEVAESAPVATAPASDEPVIELAMPPAAPDDVDEPSKADEPSEADVVAEPVPADTAEPARLAIVLPSMPSAGTNTVVQPLDSAAANDVSGTDQSGVTNHDN